MRTQITVDQVREVNAFLAQTSRSGGARVVLVELAEELNAAAANAFLKRLEEPGPSTWLVLVSHAGGRLMATLRSRCQRIAMPPGARQDARDWLAARSDAADPERLLELAGGAPLLALEYEAAGAEPLAEDLEAALDARLEPPELVRRRSGADPAWILDVLYRLCALRARRATEQGAAVGASLRLVERVTHARRAVLSQANPNVTLLLEDLLLGWRQLAARASR